MLTTLVFPTSGCVIKQYNCEEDVRYYRLTAEKAPAHSSSSALFRANGLLVHQRQLVLWYGHSTPRRSSHRSHPTHSPAMSGHPFSLP